MRAFVSLRRKADFVALRRHGRRVSTRILTLYRSNCLPGDRSSIVGITVAKTIGKAVVRNKLRRRICAIVDELLAGQAPLRLLIVPRAAAAGVEFSLLRADVGAALRR
jgi:ribonuclease P protein component